VFPMQVLVLLRGMMHSRTSTTLPGGQLIAARRALEMGCHDVVPFAELDARTDILLAQLMRARRWRCGAASKPSSP